MTHCLASLVQLHMGIFLSLEAQPACNRNLGGKYWKTKYENNYFGHSVLSENVEHEAVQ